MEDRVWTRVVVAVALVVSGGEAARGEPAARGTLAAANRTAANEAVGTAGAAAAASGAPANGAACVAPGKEAVAVLPGAAAPKPADAGAQQREVTTTKPVEPTPDGAAQPSEAQKARAKAVGTAEDAAEQAIKDTAALVELLQFDVAPVPGAAAHDKAHEQNVKTQEQTEARDRAAEALVDCHAAAFALQSLDVRNDSPGLDRAVLRAAVDRAAQAATGLRAAAVAVAELIPLVRERAGELSKATGAAVKQAARLEAAVRELARQPASDTSNERSPGVAGLSLTSGPTWTLVGDAQASSDPRASSIDFSKPSLSLGLEYASPWTLAQVVVRKSTADDSITGAQHDPAFGRAALSPSQANLGMLVHYERGHALRCQPSCDSNEIIVASTLRGYGTFEISEIKLTETSPQMSSGVLTPVAFSVGGIYRLEGRMPTGKQFGSDRLGINLYTGFTARALSGMHDGDRSGILGSTSRWYFGIEGGVSLQIGNVLIDPHVTYLPPAFGGGKSVAGLTGALVQIRMTFVLPWMFSGAGKS